MDIIRIQLFGKSIPQPGRARAKITRVKDMLKSIGVELTSHITTPSI